MAWGRLHLRCPSGTHGGYPRSRRGLAGIEIQGLGHPRQLHLWGQHGFSEPEPQAPAPLGFADWGPYKGVWPALLWRVDNFKPTLPARYFFDR